MDYLGTQLHKGKQYDYYSASDQYVYQFVRPIGWFGPVVSSGWLCSVPAWERALHRVCNA